MLFLMMLLIFIGIWRQVALWHMMLMIQIGRRGMLLLCMEISSSSSVVVVLMMMMMRRRRRRRRRKIRRHRRRLFPCHLSVNVLLLVWAWTIVLMMLSPCCSHSLWRRPMRIIWILIWRRTTRRRRGRRNHHRSCWSLLILLFVTVRKNDYLCMLIYCSHSMMQSFGWVCGELTL